MTQADTPVLIIGGSLVGLTSALLLGDLGVPSLVVERHAGTAIHARAGHFQLGTTEMLRQVGLERTVRDASAKTYHPSGGIISVESLAGEPCNRTARIEHRLPAHLRRPADVRADDVVRPAKLRRHPRVMVRQAESQRADPELVEQPAESHMAAGVRVPLGQHHDGASSN